MDSSTFAVVVYSITTSFSLDTLIQADFVPGGLLGADYEVDSNRYRFKKVFGGLNWTPELRSPLTEPGVDAVDGEYLLAVRGEKLYAPENLYSRFENSSGKLVEITDATFVLDRADMHDCRDGHANKELYLVETAQNEVAVNRANVVVMRSTVISVSRLKDVVIE